MVWRMSYRTCYPEHTARTRALLQAAAAAFAPDATAAGRWVHAPHDALFGLSPCEAAWASTAGAAYATAILTVGEGLPPIAGVASVGESP